MAPGPVLGTFWPNGGYVARDDWVAQQPGLAGEVPHGDQRVARVRAGAPGRDPRAAPAGDAERPAADLEPGGRPREAAQLAKYAKEFGVISTAAEHHEARPEHDRPAARRCRGRSANNFITAAAGRQGRDAAARREVHVRRHGHVEDAGLPARRAGREQGDEREGHRADTWTLSSRRASTSTAHPAVEAEESLPGFVSQGCVRGGRAAPHAYPSKKGAR